MRALLDVNVLIALLDPQSATHAAALDFLAAEHVRLARRLRALSEAHPRDGYRRIAALLRQEGWAIGKRQVQRLRRADGLRVPPTRRRLVRRGVSTGLPTKPKPLIVGTCGPGTL